MQYASRRSLLTAAAIFTAQACAGEDAVSKGLDSIFATHPEQAPGYLVGVVQSGELVFARGYGLADLERARRLTPGTPMNLASLSKQFTAAAIAREVVLENLSLDDRVMQHLPGLPSFMRDITIAHLIYMTSGLPEYYRLPPVRAGWGPDDGFTVDDALAAIYRAEGLEFEPGSRWAYSNTNYMLLAELVEHINQRPFARHMEEAFFHPVGMRDTWVDAPPMPQRDDRARAYVRGRDGWQLAERRSRHYGGSGVFSSLGDLARWDRALWHDHAFGEAFNALMLSTRRFNHDKANDAFGLVHGTFEGQPTIWYEGGDHGVSTYTMRLTNSETTVFCLSNIGGEDVGRKVRQIASVLLA